MATKETHNGPTPNGGVRSEAYFLNDKRELVDKSIATQVEIVEFDSNGKAIHRTYGTLRQRGNTGGNDREKINPNSA